MKSFKSFVAENLEDYGIKIEDATKDVAFREFEFFDIIKPEPLKPTKSSVQCVDIKEATLPKQRGRIVDIRLTWRNKWYYIKMFFPQTTRPTRTQVDAQLQKVYPGAKLDYFELSNYEPGQPLIT